MAIPRSGESSEGKRRAVLLLSLILLVWNLAASVRHAASVAAFPLEANPLSAPARDGEIGPDSAVPAPQSPRSGPLTIRQQYLLGKRIDINKASLAEISELPGISDKVALAVLEERKRLGRFHAPQDLLGVKGIKEKRLRKILPFLAEIPNN
ncbi:MAG: hypothetical protein OHK0028_22540 [Deltaproteobacteria bacterium]